MPGEPITPSRFLQLVADPLRWALLHELAEGDRRVGELTTLVGASQNLVSYHLGEMRSAGLVSSRRSSADGRDTYYRFNPALFGQLLRDTGVALHPALRSEPTAPVVPARARKVRVLFLCTGNSARSQIAEAFATQRAGQAITARSAGSHPKPLHPHAIEVMAAHGIDISGHTSMHLRRLAHHRFDHVVTLCDRVKEICPDLPGQPATAHWSIPDLSTHDGGYPAFVRAADEIAERVNLLIARIAAQPATGASRRSPSGGRRSRPPDD